MVVDVNGQDKMANECLDTTNSIHWNIHQRKKTEDLLVAGKI
jgi:hypothetical protein